MSRQDDLKQYRFQRRCTHDGAAWSEPRWKSIAKIIGAMVGAVGFVLAFWLLSVGLFLI